MEKEMQAIILSKIEEYVNNLFNLEEERYQEPLSDVLERCYGKDASIAMENLYQMMNSLTDRECSIIVGSTGCYGNPPITLDKAIQKYLLTSDRIQQIAMKVVHRLKEDINREPVPRRRRLNT